MRYRWNRGHGRKVTRLELDEGWLVHRSVKMRLEFPEITNGEDGFIYRPRARPNLVVKPSSDPKKEVREPHKLKHEDWNLADPDHFQWVA